MYNVNLHLDFGIMGRLEASFLQEILKTNQIVLLSDKNLSIRPNLATNGCIDLTIELKPPKTCHASESIAQNSFYP